MTRSTWEVASAGSCECGKFNVEEYFVRRPGDDVAIASEIVDPDTCEPSKVYATLIAATPNLLAACERAEQTLRNLAAYVSGDAQTIVLNEAASLRRTIVRARGEGE